MKTHSLFFVALSLVLPACVSGSDGFGTDSSIELIAPRAGEVFRVGNVLTVQWILHNGATPEGGLAVQVSPDEGRSWIRVVNQLIENGDPAYYEDSVGTYTWTIVDSAVYYASVYVHFASDKCIAMVGAPYDEVFLAAESSTFEILPASTSAAAPMDSKRSAGRGLAASPWNGGAELFRVDGRRVALPERVLPLWYGQAASGSAGAYVVRLRSGSAYHTASGILCR